MGVFYAMARFQSLVTASPRQGCEACLNAELIMRGNLISMLNFLTE